MRWKGPTPVSALIHAATMVTAGVYLLHRTAWLFALTPDVLLIVAWIGAFTALLAAVLACVQDDIKRVLAYSTVSQLGYMMAAIGAGFSTAGFFHLLTHGLFKALLFLGAGAVIHAVGSNDLSRMGGLVASHAADRDRLHRRNAVARGHPALRRIPVEGRDPRRGLGGRARGTVRAADAGRVPDGLLHVPRRVPGVLRHTLPARHVRASRSSCSPITARHEHDPPAPMLLPLWILALLSMAVGVYFDVLGPGWRT